MIDGMSDTQKRALPKGKEWERYARGALQTVGGAVPFAGGLFSAAAGHWSEREVDRIHEFLRAWIQMLEDEFGEKERTIAGIVIRLDIHDEQIAARLRSDEYQSLLKKAFRNWAGTESAKKQEYIRNILTNAAATNLTSDEVVSLFIEWLHTYSEFHFAVIAEVYQTPGTTRGDIWRRLGKGSPREDSAEADLYKLLFRDLSTGGVIRQHRETDYDGNFVRRQSPKRLGRGTTDGRMKSAFDNEEPYELTALGQQFVHYAMQELTPKVEYHADANVEGNNENGT